MSSTTVDGMATQYDSVLTELMNRHIMLHMDVPLIKKEVLIRPHLLWYTAEVVEAKQYRSQAERKWCSTKLTVHMEMLKTA